MKSFHNLRFLLAGLLLALLLGGSAIGEEIVKRQIAVEKGATLYLDNVNGTVSMEPWDEQEVWIEAVKSVDGGYDDRYKELMERTRIEIEERHGDVYVHTRHPRGDDGFFANLFGRKKTVKVDYHVKIPRDLNLEVETVNGNIELTGCTGEVNLQTVNGGIDVTDVRGTTELNTTNGGIYVAMGSLEKTGFLMAETVNGGITVSLPKNAGFELRASTVNGSLSSDFPLTIEGGFIGKNVRGTVNGGGPRVNLETVNGGISIRDDG
ncbi:MAG TPA: DUF4097 family beta strand repeat-containing protein [Calditrichia bacterium]|nr:DUF4097 family beta strand repeat protein [Calditrichota bacterium]HQU72885.1 DUF4097 family beta strand repeat-containing protein [Calditrichia bacterium]HQV34356.1 DUF4097 family beta strand repeat-containing protein [Calditrichia bacterium]